MSSCNREEVPIALARLRAEGAVVTTSESESVSSYIFSSFASGIWGCFGKRDARLMGGNRFFV